MRKTATALALLWPLILFASTLAHGAAVGGAGTAFSSDSSGSLFESDYSGSAASRSDAPPTTSLIPLPLSSVRLLGDWGEAQRRNQEVLMSLNMSQWACHFTTTANLTRCDTAMALLWHAYLKRAESRTFDYTAGYLSAGDDLAGWPAPATFAQCWNACAKASSCRGFSFQSPVSQPESPVPCYLKSAARLALSLTNCVADGGKDRPSCEPLPGEMGLGGYYGECPSHRYE